MIDPKSDVIDITKFFSYYGGCYGVFKGARNSMQDSSQQSLKAFARTIAVSAAVPGLAAAAYSLGNQGLKSLRNKDDFWNYTGGSVGAGIVIGTFLKSNRAICAATASVFSLSLIYETAGGFLIFQNEDRLQKVLEMRNR